MRKSYVQEHTLTVLVEIDLGEIGTMIDSLNELDTEQAGSYRVRELVGKLKNLRRETADDARREFERLAQQS